MKSYFISSKRLEELASEPNGSLVQIEVREECNSDTYFSVGYLNYSQGQDFIMLLNGVHPRFNFENGQYAGHASADMKRRLDISPSRFVDYKLLIPKED